MNGVQKIIKDDALDKELLEKGYVVVPFLRPEEVDELRSFYYNHHSSSLDGMYATAHVVDIPFRMKMNNFIKEKFARAVAEMFHEPPRGLQS